ncbi:hypothetical protein P368_23235 [Comamonas thiooxydans]|nr:hypothetical protein P365_19415 [Comamonas thiooxydans]KGH04903.1 hypothetical protein P368_23235 [Comamonas thiooxydans]
MLLPAAAHRQARVGGNSALLLLFGQASSWAPEHGCHEDLQSEGKVLAHRAMQELPEIPGHVSD